MSARKSRTPSLPSGSLNELKAKWDLWCEDEGVEDPPEIVRVDTLKRPIPSGGPFVEQSQDEYVKFCRNNRADEERVEASTEIHVLLRNVEPCAVKGIRVQGTCADRNLLIKCSLLAESMHMLGFLLKNSSVTHLYLDENIINDQNYHLALKDNFKLLYYSLRLNMITDIGAIRLANSLECAQSANQTLRSLNLNGNLIDDDGARALADALRWNRSLSYLSLAGNRICDRGGSSLAAVLLPFNLTRKELEYRGEHICNRLFRMKTLMDDCIRDSQKIAMNFDGYETEQPPDHPGENCDTDDLLMYYYDLEKWVEERVPQVEHCMVADVVETDEGQYMCKGNVSLRYLNLSYNLLTEEALMAFMEAFRYRENSIVNYEKKVWFMYEGNKYDPQHSVVEELESYLRQFGSDLSLELE
ncbi:LRR [Nesidiocoris tenuis]|uniref:LRR n=1 Tax=Nesidiocoris tenuis TaxID=355587 RepID=A0ABN7AQ08_9HEMI|nr:LRR [Nesidiocoris tenuis]